MYEPVATTFYEKLNNLTVLEFGLVPHPEFKIFGASPDGICDIDSPSDYIGRMLEIKCPPKRNFTSEVPRHYWMQMQGQLESCDLEECDFLETIFKEYENEEAFLNDGNKFNKTKDDKLKGVIIRFFDGNEPVYKYPPLNLNKEQFELLKE